MENIFEQLIHEYGLHDTQFYSINNDALDIIFNFNDGIYLLDETGKETVLSQPMQIVLRLQEGLDSFEDAFEIRDLGKKFKSIDYSLFEKYLKKEPYEIGMVYYNNFNNIILFDGGFKNKHIVFSVEWIDKIIVRELNRQF